MKLITFPQYRQKPHIVISAYNGFKLRAPCGTIEPWPCCFKARQHLSLPCEQHVPNKLRRKTAFKDILLNSCELFVILSHCVIIFLHKYGSWFHQQIIHPTVAQLRIVFWSRRHRQRDKSPINAVHLVIIHSNVFHLFSCFIISSRHLWPHVLISNLTNKHFTSQCRVRLMVVHRWKDAHLPTAACLI